MLTRRRVLGLVAVIATVSGLWLAAQGSGSSRNSVKLLNVSYDVSQELWIDLNEAFLADRKRQSGDLPELAIRQSHGGSGSQARSVVEGLDANVVTLNVFADTDLLRKKGLFPGWEERLANRSLPFNSTSIFVVCRGNPKNDYD